ncbi:MAG: serine/threonine-protein phosphatase [Tabrizicola sp.]|nr:serine/threonine-protein phosphatase [Tabrizicola sp.]
MLIPITVIPPAEAPRLRGEGAALTHRGCVRDRNEDSIITDPTGKLWAVADGMGGYGYGDVASDIVMDCLSRISDDAEPITALVTELDHANQTVRARARELSVAQMGSTVVAMILSQGRAHIAWVGDSRAYLFRRGNLRLLTRDHSLVQDMVDQGSLSPEDAERHPEANIVTRAIGGDETLEPDSMTVPVFRGDRLMLCSDGLTRAVYEQEIADALAVAPDPAAACTALMRKALDAGAPDNVSIIVIAMEEASGATR